MEEVMKAILTIVITLLAATGIHAEQGGSCFLQDIKELLAQQGVLWDSLQSSFDIYSVGDAHRISSTQNRELAGIRIGPYHLWAKPKNSPGPFIFEIALETETSFVDKSNKAVALKHATDLHEKFLAIKIKPLAPKDYFTPPPE
jgi:hypothetical protein